MLIIAILCIFAHIKYRAYVLCWAYSLPMFIAFVICHRVFINSEVLLNITSGIVVKCNNWCFRNCFYGNI